MTRGRAESPVAAPDLGPAPIVVALGGNAISPVGVSDSIERQFEQTRRTAVALADLLCRGAPVVIAHGNGPQVGSAVRRTELAAHEVYTIPLDVSVADVQGGMGYMISQCLNNELGRRGMTKRVSTIITSIEVDADDPAFARPTKPIGPLYPRDREADLRSRGWDIVAVEDRGFRRVVPSPRPRAVVEIDLIRELVARGRALIAAGGGGIPVVRDRRGDLSGREAVIDKDLASGLIAHQIGADVLFIVTSVAQVALDFGTPRERSLDSITLEEARRHLAARQFPAGSMGPKIEAAVEFLERSPRSRPRVIITDIAHMHDALAGQAGTVLTR